MDPVHYSDRSPLSPDSAGSAVDSEVTGGSRTDDGSDEGDEEEGSEEEEEDSDEGEGR